MKEIKEGPKKEGYGDRALALHLAAPDQAAECQLSWQVERGGHARWALQCICVCFGVYAWCMC